MKKTLLLILLAVVGLSSCKKDDDKNNNNATNTPTVTPDPFSLALTSNTIPFFKGTIGGGSEHYVLGEGGVATSMEVQNFENLPYPTPVIEYLYPNTSFYKEVNDDFFSLIRFRFELKINNNETSFTEFRNRLNNGVNVFAPQPYGVGVEVIWTENDAALPDGYRRWSTAFGAANQSNSSFEIIESITYERFGEQGVVLKAQFNCTLYNEDNNLTKTLSGGQLIAAFAYR